MKRINNYIQLLIVNLLLLVGVCVACIRPDDAVDTPKGNFDALWTILDKGYCFFEDKNIDWDAVYDKYKSRISPDMPDEGLFEVFSEMLAELKDGHVNLTSSADMGRYWAWYEDYPVSFYPSIQDLYLGTDYRIAGGLKYRILPENIGYISYSSFTDAVGESGLNKALSHLAICDGLIFDIRNNGGGSLTYSERIAGRFTEEKQLVGYIMHKIGTAHDAFSSPEAIYVDPSTSDFRWLKPCVLLTDRKVYSAANDFTNSMKGMPNVTVMGTKTGGGAGLPFSSELPNGWMVRYSAVPTYDKDMNLIEFGIEPDVELVFSDEDRVNQKDTFIEEAIDFLLRAKQNQLD